MFRNLIYIYLIFILSKLSISAEIPYFPTILQEDNTKYFLKKENKTKTSKTKKLESNKVTTNTENKLNITKNNINKLVDDKFNNVKYELVKSIKESINLERDKYTGNINKDYLIKSTNNKNVNLTNELKNNITELCRGKNSGFITVEKNSIKEKQSNSNNDDVKKININLKEKRSHINISTTEWKGIQTVLQQDQLNENVNYRKCVLSMTEFLIVRNIETIATNSVGISKFILNSKLQKLFGSSGYIYLHSGLSFIHVTNTAIDKFNYEVPSINLNAISFSSGWQLNDIIAIELRFLISEKYNIHKHKFGALYTEVNDVSQYESNEYYQQNVLPFWDSIYEFRYDMDIELKHVLGLYTKFFIPIKAINKKNISTYALLGYSISKYEYSNLKVEEYNARDTEITKINSEIQATGILSNSFTVPYEKYCSSCKNTLGSLSIGLGIQFKINEKINFSIDYLEYVITGGHRTNGFNFNIYTKL